MSGAETRAGAAGGAGGVGGADGLRELRVESVRAAAEGVAEIVLRAPDGGSLPAWEPGAHVDLALPNGLVRQYSLCGDPRDAGRWRIAVLRERDSRGGSAWLHDELRAGATLPVSAPRNHFPLVDAEEYLFVAGGIGITPLLPMAAEVARRGLPWRLAYGGRTAATMAFAEELCAAHGDAVALTCDDRDGPLDLDALLGTPRDGVAVYCCGPEGLLAAVEARCAAWPAGALHVERFSPREGALDGARSGFEVELAASGITLSVSPDETIAEALEAAGIDVPTSCREGTCGTCETFVLDGEIDHRDSFLTEQERADGELMMVCCSRAAGPRLVLDL